MRHERGGLAQAFMACVLGVLSASGTLAADRWAVVIGIDGYEAMGKLKTCVKDARAVADALVKHGGFDKKHMVLLTDETKVRKNLPTRANIERRIEMLVRIAEPGDTALIYFSGHGITVNGRGYVVPLFGDRKRAIPLAWLKDQLGKCRAANRIMILDACHAGAAQKGVGGVAQSMAARTTAGMLMLLSCGRDEFSYPDPKTGHSIFSRFLLEALRGDADANKDLRLTNGELLGFLKRRMKVWSFQSSKTQTPVANAAARLESVFCVLGAATPARPATPVPLPKTRPEKKAIAPSMLRLFEARYNTARREWQRVEKLYAAKVISSGEREKASRAYQEAKAGYEAAKEGRDPDVAALAVTVRFAKEQWELSQKLYSKKITSRSSVNKAEAEFLDASIRYETARGNPAAVIPLIARQVELAEQGQERVEELFRKAVVSQYERDKQKLLVMAAKARYETAIADAVRLAKAAERTGMVVSGKMAGQFVHVSLVAKRGARVGRSLVVLRGGRYVGVVKVVKAMALYSGASIVHQAKGATIQNGDMVADISSGQ